MHTLWIQFIYEPLYNGLIFIAQQLTAQDVGLAVVVLTIGIRLCLFPLSKKSLVGQYKMRALEPKIQAIKAKGLPKELEAKETFALYKQEKMNPFAGCLYLLIQLPILFALIYVFQGGVYQPSHLYAGLSTDGLKETLLGLLSITKPSLVLAILAGITQGIQAFLMPKPKGTGNDFQTQFTKSMSTQMRYVLPLVIIFAATKFPAAVSLYWVVTNLFSIFQELYIRRKVTSTIVLAR